MSGIATAPKPPLPLGIKLIAMFHLAVAAGTAFLAYSEFQAPGKLPVQVLQMTLLCILPTGIMGMLFFMQRPWAWQVVKIIHMVLAVCLFLFAGGWFIYEMGAMAQGGKGSGIAMKFLPAVVGLPALLGALALGVWGYIRKPEVRAAYGADVPPVAK